MRHCVVDKRVAGIIRWLERLKKSYSSGAMESALMEAECARADLENLRNDVWERVRPSSHDSKILRGLACMIRSVVLAFVIIALAVAPIARDPVPAPSEEMKAVTPPKPIIVIREYEQEKPEPKAPSRPEPPLRKPARKTAVKKPAVTKAPVQTQQTASAKKVPYDKVVSLVQTGQRALKNDQSVISIK